MAVPRSALLVCIFAAAFSVRVAAQETATITGLVLDAAARPLGDVLVFVGPGSQSSFTDSLGIFSLDAIPGGSHVLAYRKVGYAPRSFGLVLVAGDARDVGTVSLQAGAEPAATLRGSVVEQVGSSPLQGATVELNGRIVAETNVNGLFDVPEVALQWGTNELKIRHRLFADVEATDQFWVANPNETVEFAIVLDVAPVTLSGVDVEAARFVPVKLQGFYERMEDSPGTFFTRDEIELRSPRRITDLFTSLRFTSRSRAASSFGRAATPDCLAPLVFLDGSLIGSESRPLYVDDRMYPNINQYVHPDDVEAVEVYDAVASVPSLFSQSGSGCGVIAIWTR